jgi:hypothetical protein
LSQVRKCRARKDLHELSQSGGHAKNQRRLARSIIAGATMQYIQKRNAQTGSKQRLCGSEEIQIQSGKVLATILSKKEVSTMLESPCMQSVTTKIANECLEKIGSQIGAAEICEIKDSSGMTDIGYSKIYRKFKNGIKAVGSGLRVGCLPRPWHVSLLRREMNAKLRDFVGDYYSISNILEIQPSTKSKKKETVRVELTTKNSFFVDVEMVQRTMVALYNFTPEGVFIYTTLVCNH